MDEEKQLNDNRPPFPASETPEPTVEPRPEAEPARARFTLPGTHLVDDLIMGLRFYSRLPTGDSAHLPPQLDRIAMALPFASLVIGVGPALLLILGAWIGMPPLLIAALAVAMGLIIAGGMAEDGLADAADGLFGGNNPGRRLDIMRDSRHGTYGMLAIVMLLIIRVTALGAAAAINPLLGGALMLAAGVLSRSGSLYLSQALPHARLDGLSVSVGRVSRNAFIVGAAFAAVLAFVLAAPGAHLMGYVTAMVLAGGVTVFWVWLCHRLVGGQTGDLIGALQALIEVAALTGFAVFF